MQRTQHTRVWFSWAAGLAVTLLAVPAMAQCGGGGEAMAASAVTVGGVNPAVTSSFSPQAMVMQQQLAAQRMQMLAMQQQLFQQQQQLLAMRNQQMQRIAQMQLDHQADQQAQRLAQAEARRSERAVRAAERIALQRAKQDRLSGGTLLASIQK